MIVPIFIHVKEKSDKEIIEEMARERRWKELMEKEEEAKRRSRHEAEQRKIEEKRRKEKELNDWYFNLRYTDEWETQILPDGWNILGQQYIPVLREYYKEKD